MAKEYKDLIVGLDIGTAKVMVVVAELLPDGQLRVAGIGTAPRARSVKAAAEGDAIIRRHSNSS